MKDDKQKSKDNMIGLLFFLVGCAAMFRGGEAVAMRPVDAVANAIRIGYVVVMVGLAAYSFRISYWNLRREE